MKYKSLSIKIKFIFCIISLINIAVFPTWSQDKVRIFTNIDFNLVAPEEVDNYLNLEGKLWKPIQQEHIKEGGLLGWSVYRVWFTGTGSKYNYAVMEMYNKYEDMSFEYSNDIITKVHPGIDEQKLMNDTYKAREIVKAQSAVRTRPRSRTSRGSGTPSGRGHSRSSRPCRPA